MGWLIHRLLYSCSLFVWWFVQASPLAHSTSHHYAVQLFSCMIRMLADVSSSTAVDTSDVAWRQAEFSLIKGGLGLHFVHQHAPATYLACVCASGFYSQSNHHFFNCRFNFAVPPDEALQNETLLSVPTVLPKKLLPHPSTNRPSYVVQVV